MNMKIPTAYDAITIYPTSGSFIRIPGGTSILVVKPGAVIDPYWPVSGVTKPQHLWPFAFTGDYTDQGSTGGLDLTAQGSGNSFGATGLILDGNGYAECAVTGLELGAQFSWFVKMQSPAVGKVVPFELIESVLASYFIPYFTIDSSGLSLGNLVGEEYVVASWNGPSGLVLANTPVLLLATYNAGVLKFYTNGVEETPVSEESTLTSIPAITGTLTTGYDSEEDVPAEADTAIAMQGLWLNKVLNQTEITAINAALMA